MLLMEAQRHPTGPRASRRLGLALAAGLLGLVLVEVGLRVQAWRADSRELLAAARLGGRLEPGQAVTLGQIIRVSADEELIYELRPNLRGVLYERAPLFTDAEGRRVPGGKRRRAGAGAETPAETPASDPARAALTLVGLGDSVMFGQGVNQPDAYLSQLEASLQARLGADGAEVWNLAVPGYNTAMEVASLRAKGLALAPDAVVLGFVENDVSLPRFLRKPGDFFDLGHSLLLERLGFGARDASEPGPAELLDAPLRSDGERLFGIERNPERVPEEYRHLVGWPAVEHALDELRSLAREHDFPVFFVVHRGNDLTRTAVGLAAERGFHVVDLSLVVERYMEKHGIAEFQGSVLTVGETDPHPSPVLHGMVHRALLQALEEEGLVEAR